VVAGGVESMSHNSTLTRTLVLDSGNRALRERIPQLQQGICADLIATLEGVDPERVNVNGGAIALGHPMGATGAMLLGAMLDELERRDLNVSLVTLCSAGGMAPAAIIERI
jgi:acetyl-CoA C-acetyltransferase